MRRIGWRDLLSIVLILCLAGIAGGERNAYGAPPRSVPYNLNYDNPDHLIRQLAPERNIQRQQTLVQDAQEVLKLANEINDAVSKNSDGTISPDTLNKVEEVEKLTQEVKQKAVGE